MRYFLFLGLIVCYLLVWFIFFKPFKYEVRPSVQESVVFYDFLYRSFAIDGSSFVLQGKKGVKRSKEIEVIQPIAYRNGEKITAQKGIFHQDKNSIDLFDKIVYLGKEYTLKSSKAHYDISSEILSIDSPFVIESDRYTIFGKELKVNKKLGRIWSKKVKAIIKSEE
ncbi:LPS export ABC transporter periplasmic protein LptC [Nitratiruptor sp. SB155-2]|uniref:LPS export ABC transporter periplasmic protein LptC n=1 Tax=Nitratiruptor sp. (strain SB155-2) TaxID=387092 RepID=UPI00015873D3|nr:LPS export ABC transporter periplasmic protein LptC [Nitratiruptor sp. SB155-2]BAF69891.1 hypothetical protein NIS_0779 [Nitratiruptor sp. SB155-2]